MKRIKSPIIPSKHRSLVSLALPLLIATLCKGQVTDSSEGRESVIDLDPFVVHENNAGSYLTRNSLSATRFVVAVKDIPITITSLTEQFLDDTASITLEDAVRFSAGITRAADIYGEEEGRFNIRGVEALSPKRNGVSQLYSMDLTNVSRVEIVKGPMSVLYGQVQPGGLVNYITKDALTEFRGDFSVKAGNDGYYRAQLGITGPILKGKGDHSKGRLLYRIDTSYQTYDGWRELSEDERSFYSGLLDYKPFGGTTIELQWDYLNKNGSTSSVLQKTNRRWLEIFEENVDQLVAEFGYNNVRVLAQSNPYLSYEITDSNGVPVPVRIGYTRQWDTYATHWGYSNNVAPDNNFNNVDLHNGSVEVRQQFGESWTARLYYNYTEALRESVWGQTWGLFLSGQMAGYSNNYWHRENENHVAQLDLSGEWELGPVRNQTLVSIEYLDTDFLGKAWVGRAQGTLVVNPRRIDEFLNDPNNPYLNPDLIAQTRFMTGIPDNPRNPEAAPAVLEGSRDEVKAGLVSNIFHLMDDRLVILAGVRYDELDSVGNVSYAEDAVSPQLGVLGKVTDDLNLYAMYSESFVPQFGFGRRLRSEEAIAADIEAGDPRPVPWEAIPLSPFDGEGIELGAKWDGFDGKVSASIAAFEIEKMGVATQIAVEVYDFLNPINGEPLSTRITSQDSGEKVTGLETELFISAIPNWQIVLGYAYIESETILNPTVAEQYRNNGISTQYALVGVPEHQVTLWTKYQFNEGNLEGLSLGGGVQWLDRRLGSLAFRGGNPGTVQIGAGEEALEDFIYLDDQLRVDLMLAYQWRFDRADVNFQLNVNNVLDEYQINPGGLPLDPRRIFASLQVSF